MSEKQQGLFKSMNDRKAFKNMLFPIQRELLIYSKLGFVDNDGIS